MFDQGEWKQIKLLCEIGRVEKRHLHEGPAANFLEQKVQALACWRDALFSVIAKLEKRLAYSALPFLQTLDDN